MSYEWQGRQKFRSPVRLAVLRGGGSRAHRALRTPRPDGDVRGGRPHHRARRARDIVLRSRRRQDRAVVPQAGERGSPKRRGGPRDGGEAPPHIVSHPGYPVGWASIVKPHRYRATAVARERTKMLVLSRDLFEQYTKEHPDFGLAFMRRVLWLIGNHLRMTRTRLVATRCGDVPRTVRALLEQNATALSVTSHLHKIPHYLENRLTLDDAR